MKATALISDEAAKHLARTVTTYGDFNPIWDRLENMPLELVAEAHSSLLMRFEEYAEFYLALTEVEQGRFVNALVEGVGTDPKSWSAGEDMITAGVEWCIAQGFSYEKNAGFLKTRDHLRSDGVRLVVDEWPTRFGEIICSYGVQY